MSDRKRLVIHILPIDVARGAQEYAGAMAELLSSEEWEHRVLVLFGHVGSSRPPSFVGLGRPASKRSRGFLDPGTLLELRRYLKIHRPGIVVAHGSEPFLYTSIVAPVQTKLAYYRIGVSGPKLQNSARRWMYRLLARRWHRVLGVSEETLVDSSQILGVPAAKLALVPNGRDPSAYAQKRQDASRGAVTLAWVSHVTSHKRPQLFLDLMKQLRDGGCNVRGMLIGDGPELDAIRAEATGLGDVLEVLGRRGDVPELLQAADVFCFTSEGENEGMPGVLIEAGLAGLPTVTTSVPGASTVVAHGVSGFVVDVDDVDGFLVRATELVLDADLRETMGMSARGRCIEQFTLEASARKMHEALEELI